MARPRKADLVKQLGPLGGASARLQLLERAGLTPESKADILRSFIEQARRAMESAMFALAPDQPDWNARLRAGAQLVQLIEALPPRSASAAAHGPQVVVVNEIPAWARDPQQAKAVVVEAGPGTRALEAGGSGFQKSGPPHPPKVEPRP
jgi:hypothetical protein